MKKIAVVNVLFLVLMIFSTPGVFAQTGRAVSVSPTVSLEQDESTESAEVSVVPTVAPKADLTQPTQEAVEPLRKILEAQEIKSILPFNFIKYAIRSAINAGIPANTIVLLLLLPLIASIIAATRHLIGIRGFGIFLPAALSVVFMATGPIVGIALFIVIVLVSTLFRLVLRKAKVKLQYLPKMSLLLLFVVLGVMSVLFAAPVIERPELSSVSIFPVLILVLLAEDFSRVQTGKSAKVAANLTTETLILALFSYIILTLETVQRFALLHPEGLILGLILFNIAIGKYVGLRFREVWRFRKLISG